MARPKEQEPLVTVTLRLFAADVARAKEIAEREMIQFHPILRRAVRAGLQARDARVPQRKGV
jgi:hypothetical protein